MKIEANFGFVTGCHAGDRHMVHATLASMRYYCPEVPICLVVDGDFDVSDLEKEYKLIILRITDLPSKEMRSLIGNNYRAKLAAMWEGPFERYVWLDSDAIIWGDFTSQVRSDLDFQIFWKEKENKQKKETTINNDVSSDFKHYYFNPDDLVQYDPNFRWRGNNYFCSGAFSCCKNVIRFEEWIIIESWLKNKPNMFGQLGEMGMLNYIVHAKAQRAEIKIDSIDLQHIWMHHGKEEIINDCAASGWEFPKLIERPRVLHFCGRKPWTLDRNAYSRPFTIARLTHYRSHHSELVAWMAVMYEDFLVLLRKINRKLFRN